MKSVDAIEGRHMVEPVTCPTQVVMSMKVESVTKTGEVPENPLLLQDSKTYIHLFKIQNPVAARDIGLMNTKERALDRRAALRRQQGDCSL